MFQELFNIYTPIIFGVLIGLLLKPTNEELAFLAKIVVYIFLSSLLFVAAYTRFSRNPDPQVLILSLLSSLGSLLTFIFTRLMRENPEITLTAMYANAGYLPVGIAQSLYGEEGVASVGFYILGNNATSNILAPTLSKHRIVDLKNMITRVVTFPPVTAILLGSLIGLSGLKIPDSLIMVLKPFSDSAASIALLELGLEFSMKPRLDLDGFKAYFYRLAIVIPLTLVFTNNVAMRGVDRNVAIIESVMPGAVSCVPISRELGLDASKVARIIFTSTLLSTAVALPIVVYAMGLLF
ncbi:MAG: AEC family transporter [Infirmifilum uzonense]|uniref:AEC family transporter n=1 Tax=Infirmifilum uzonense TaxID=1550241 RepID=UPI003C74C0A0